MCACVCVCACACARARARARARVRVCLVCIFTSVDYLLGWFPWNCYETARTFEKLSKC